MASEGGVADLIRRAHAGEREAYDQLFALAADRVLLFIRMRLGEGLRARVDSMDVLQEAYLEAHRALPEFEPRDDGAFARWLCKIAENRIRGLADHFGAKKRQGKVEVTAVLERAKATGTGPMTAVARRENRELLAAAMERLEGKEREALMLRYFQDRTVEDVASLMGRSPTAVRRLLGRAAIRLGEELGRGGGKP